MLVNMAFAQTPHNSNKSNIDVTDLTQTVLVNEITMLGQGDLITRQVGIEELLAQAIAARTSFPSATLSVDQLHGITEKLTHYVRQQGYKFHTVYLPPQEVVNGKVVFIYTSAVLSDVHIIKPKKADKRDFKSPFADLIDRELYVPAVEQKIFALRALSDVKVFAFFSRGKMPGEVRLNIKIEHNTSGPVSITADNLGTESSGEYRLAGELNINSHFKDFDHFNLVLFQTAGEENSNFGFASYSYPLTPLDTRLQVSVGNSAYNIGKEFATLDMSGEANSYQLGIEHTLDHAPTTHTRVKFQLYQKNSSLEIGSNKATEEVSRAGVIGASWSTRFGAAQHRLSSGINYIHGEYDELSREGYQSLEKLEYRVRLSSQFINKSLFNPSPSLFIRGQYADEALPSIESASLSGFYGVRAHASGAFSAHSVTLATLNANFDNAFGFIKNPKIRMVPSVFYDYGHGITHFSELDSEHLTIEGIGAALSLKFYSFSASLTYADPINVSNKINEADNQWLFQLRWN